MNFDTLRRCALTTAAFALLLCACRSTSLAASTPTPASAPASKGWLLIVGGGGTTPEMYERMFTAAGGKDAKVVVLPQASELADTGSGSVEVWKGHGATNVGWLDLADPVQAASEIRAARVIWFPGGVQTRLMDALHKAGVDGLVRERYAAGAVVGGTSAGAAVMTDVMITGDYDLTAMTPPPAPAAAPAPTPAPSAEPAAQAPAGAAPRAAQADEDSGLKYVRPGTNVFAHGLGLLEGAIVDQHFVRRQRFNRLLSAVIDHPDLVGIGIDEKTAILVHGTRFEVVGASNVLVVDARGTTPVDREKSKPGALRGLGLHVLRAGMEFDLARAQR